MPLSNGFTSEIPTIKKPPIAQSLTTVKIVEESPSNPVFEIHELHSTQSKERRPSSERPMSTGFLNETPTLRKASHVPSLTTIKYVEEIQPKSLIEVQSPTQKEKPSTLDRPIFETQILERPIIEPRVIERPVIERPLIEVDRQLVERPMLERPVIERQIVERPVIERPVIERQLIERPVIERQLVERPVVERPVIERQLVERPMIERPLIERQLVERPMVERPLIERQLVERPVIERPVVEMPLVERPVIERQIMERPVTERPVIDRQVFETQIIERPVYEAHIIDFPLIENKFERPPTIVHEKNFRGRCCKTIHEVDDFQCCDCTNGKCPLFMQWLVTMLGCPTWLWILKILAFCGLIAGVIFLAVQAGTTYRTHTIYQYIIGTNTLYSNFNLSISYYFQYPCLDPNFNSSNLTTVIPLCNVTTTRVVTNSYQNQVTAQSINSVITSGTNTLKFQSLILYLVFFLKNF